MPPEAPTEAHRTVAHGEYELDEPALAAAQPTRRPAMRDTTRPPAEPRPLGTAPASSLPWVLRFVAIFANGLLLLVSASNLFLGNCCMGVVGVAAGGYCIQALLRHAFAGMERPIGIVAGILVSGAGVASVGLAVVMQQMLLPAEIPESMRPIIMVNVFALAGVYLLAGAATLASAAAPQRA